jgi:large subunit ribosomal protein L13
VRTTLINKKSDIQPVWYLIDAENKTIGRLSSKIATLLRGKNKVNYSPDTYFGDHVIVVNADKAILTGNKSIQKMYYKHTRWMGGIKEIPYLEMIKKHPDFPIKKAVKGMLPKNKIAQKMLLNLKIYQGIDHPHSAQKPIKVEYKEK